MMEQRSEMSLKHINFIKHELSRSIWRFELNRFHHVVWALTSTVFCCVSWLTLFLENWLSMFSCVFMIYCIVLIEKLIFNAQTDLFFIKVGAAGAGLMIFRRYSLMDFIFQQQWYYIALCAKEFGWQFMLLLKYFKMY